MSKRILILGLGNIGTMYRGTRHNVGFHVVEELVDFYEGNFFYNKSLHAYVMCRKEKEDMLIIAKPTTYMNLSGRAARSLLSWYKISPEHCVVVADTVDLPVGTLRCKGPSKKSSSTHNGIRSLVSYIGAGFYKLYIGVGKRKSKGHEKEKPLYNTSSYVLDVWEYSDNSLYKKMFQYSATILKDVLQYPLEEISKKLSIQLNNDCKQ